MSEERLQKLLARAGMASRRHVEEMIRAGRITVNGAVAELGTKADPARDAVKLDGKRVPLGAVEPVYLLLHKPPAVMSTVEDPEGRPTVMDLVPAPLRKGLFPVGRLDFQTTGLMILTNDGDFALKVSHPRYGCTKTYEVKIKGRPEPAKLDRLRQGITIERKKTAPATIEQRPMPRGVGSPDNSWWTVVLNEGRTRQIREMFLRIGHPVQKLRRIAIGPIGDKKLPLGHVRELSLQEIKALLSPQAETPAAKRALRRKESRSTAGRKGAEASASGPQKRGRAGKEGAAVEPKGRGPRSGGPKERGPKERSPRAGGPKERSPRAGGPKERSPRAGSPKERGPRAGGPKERSPKERGPRAGGPRVGKSAGPRTPSSRPAGGSRGATGRKASGPSSGPSRPPRSPTGRASSPRGKRPPGSGRRKD